MSVPPISDLVISSYEGSTQEASLQCLLPNHHAMPAAYEDAIGSLDELAEKYFSVPAKLTTTGEASGTSVYRRITRHICRQDFYNVFEAIHFANYHGYVMNVELTIVWARGGYTTPEAIDEVFSELIEKFRKVCCYRKLPAVYYAVFENGHTAGYHAHIHLHFPYERRSELRRWLRQSLRSADGKPFPRYPKDIKFHKDNHTFGQWEWFKYLMKGLDPSLRPSERKEGGPCATFTKAVGIYSDEPTGEVAIKRVRLSRLIGLSARRKVGYRLKNLFALPDKLRYGSREYVRGLSARSGGNYLEII